MRKTISMILLVSLWTQMVFAAGVPQKFPTDTLQIGKPSSSANKDLIFDTNLGASNPKVRANPISGKFELNKPLDVTGAIGATGAVSAGGAISTTSGDISTANGNLSATGTGSIGGNLTIGTGAAADKSITVNRGGSNPFLKWSETALSWIFSNDGTLEKKLGTGGGGASTGVNVLTNDSFEDFVSGALLGWSNVGGTLTQATYTNGVENDTKYFQFVATGAGQYFESALITVPTNFNGGGCQVDFKKLNIATNDLFKVEALDSSSNVLATGNVKISSWSKFPTLSFVCPTAGATFRVRVTSLAAGTLQGDKAYLGSNQNIVNISQATLVGTIEWPATAGCNWAFPSSTSYIPPAVVAACPTPTVSGAVTAPAQKTPAFNLDAKVGTYMIVFNGALVNAGGNTKRYSWWDGTLRSEGSSNLGSAGSNTLSSFTSKMTYTSPGIKSINLQGLDEVSGGSTLYNDNASRFTSVQVYFFPAGQETAVSPEQSSWFIDANIGGGNASSSGNISTYTELTNPTLDLVINTSKGSASAEIACASGTASTGLTCTSNESVGIAFVPVLTGLHRVCFDFSTNTTNNQTNTFQVIETPNTSQTILQEGGSRVQAGFNVTSGSIDFPNKVCGNFVFSDTSKRTIRLMSEANGTGTTLVLGDRSATLGQRDIHVTVENVTFGQNRPILTGDQVRVIGGTNEKIVRSWVEGSGTNGTCSTTPCTLNSNKGIASVTRASAGVMIGTFATPFTSKPVCNISAGALTASSASGCFRIVPNTATFEVRSFVCNTGGADDSAYQLICIGE